MPRPPTITDEQILDAAREVFLEKGVTATTAEVAKRAGCAEGSIFKRFCTKDELFSAAMKSTTELPEWIQTLCEAPGQGDLYDKLVKSGLEAIDFFRRIMPMMMMSWSHPSAAFDSPIKPPPVRALQRLASYFSVEMRLGRLRKHDPEIFARVYAGSIVHYVFMEVVFKANELLPLAPETFMRGLVDLIWSGACPVLPGLPTAKQKG